MRIDHGCKNIILLMSIFSLLTACTSSPPVPQDNFYHLATIQAPNKHQHKLTLVLKDFQGDGLYRERALLYINAPDPLQTRRYSYHFWIKSPTKLIRQHMASYLLNSQFAEQIKDRPLLGDKHYEISGRIERLERMIDEGTSKVIVGLRLELSSTADRNRIFSKTYMVEKEVEGKRIHDAVESYSGALVEIYEQFVADVSLASKP